MRADPGSPLWDVYDLHRTVRLNVKYYSFNLERLRKINFWMEFILALTASAAIVAFNIWKTPIGSFVWQVLSGISAILAVAKPLLKLTEKIRSLEEVVTGFGIVDHDLKILSFEIRKKGDYDNALYERFIAINEKVKTLLAKEINDGSQDINLTKKLQEQVKLELPVDKFFFPQKKYHDT